MSRVLTASHDAFLHKAFGPTDAIPCPAHQSCRWRLGLASFAATGARVLGIIGSLQRVVVGCRDAAVTGGRFLLGFVALRGVAVSI